MAILHASFLEFVKGFKNLKDSLPNQFLSIRTFFSSFESYILV